LTIASLIGTPLKTQNSKAIAGRNIALSEREALVSTAIPTSYRLAPSP
jgi:hypothetical protein